VWDIHYRGWPPKTRCRTFCAKIEAVFSASTMKRRQLGRSQLMVSPLALGASVFGWTVGKKDSFDVLDAFAAGGGNFIDTADVYCRWATGQGGESEAIIGDWMSERQNRERIVLATKVGVEMGIGRHGLSKRYVLDAADQSLRRLKTDFIDLYQSHRDDGKTPVEDTLEAYQQLMRAGKVRYIGASNFTAARLQESLNAAKRYDLPRYECIQPKYNLLERREFETELETMCLDNRLGVINYYPLATGFLTGKYRMEADLGKSVRGGGIGRFLNEKGFGVLDALDAIAVRHKCTPAAIALAWCLARRSITAPIASATSAGQVHELVRAADVKLSAEEVDALNSCSSY
jgi:aryl-alcohol dehydrogenase-like predicted oxidoreductase